MRLSERRKKNKKSKENIKRMPRIIFAHEWRYPKVIIGLFCVEFLLTIACLTLSGIADPDTYRTKLWQNGSDKGFNSNPNELLYAYANYMSLSTPIVWSALYVYTSTPLFRLSRMY